MATTRIMPLHIGKGRTESRAISDIIDYVANPQKTDNGKLITGYGCDSRTADAEFLLAKRQYNFPVFPVLIKGLLVAADFCHFSLLCSNQFFSRFCQADTVTPILPDYQCFAATVDTVVIAKRDRA